jgi:hypothetical protein
VTPIEILTKVKERWEKYPSRHRQSEWLQPIVDDVIPTSFADEGDELCGTACCLGGESLLVAGLAKIEIRGSVGQRYLELVDQHGDPLNVEPVAAEALGLTPGQAFQLFFCMDNAAVEDWVDDCVAAGQVLEFVCQGDDL